MAVVGLLPQLIPVKIPEPVQLLLQILNEIRLTATVPYPIASLLIEQLNDYTARMIVSQNGIVDF